jgi:acid phosphatase (class A)
MNRKIFAFIAAFMLLCATLSAQSMDAPRHAPVHATYFVDTKSINLSLIIPPPPAQDSETTKAELAEMHRIEKTRTPAQIAAAQSDDNQMDIFIYRTVLGEKFNAADLPLTTALSTHVHDDGWAASELKGLFKRPRPYQYDKTLHPICGTTDRPNSYPSGHSIGGYLEAFVLAQIVPEKSTEILARADDYAHNREVCGVHYPSDLAGGRSVAYAIFGNMLASPRFQADLAAARAETRKCLGLN